MVLGFLGFGHLGYAYGTWIFGGNTHETLTWFLEFSRVVVSNYHQK